MDALVIVCFSIIFGLLGFLLFLLLKASRTIIDEEIIHSSSNSQSEISNDQLTNDSNELRAGNKAFKSHNAKILIKKPRQDDESNQSSNEDKPQSSSKIELNTKIGKKKLQKLEMKAEKKAAREAEIQLREERRLQKEKDDEIMRELEEERELREREKEEEEKRLIAEQKQREYEQYLKAKKAFVVEEEGFETNFHVDSQNKLVEFINYIKEKKIVMLEELAGEFKMKTQDVITRIQELLNNEQLEGVIDDRGKFIYITPDEFDSVAKFIRQNGRVSITDLVENSNRLIKLHTEM